MKYFLIAGERSGDQHAARLIAEIKAIDPDARLIGIGGDAMRDEGMQLLIHYQSMSYMGIVEVLKHLPDVLHNLRQTKKLLTAHRPDVLILVDFAAFNLKIAKYAKRLDLKVAYYIAPKVWAWNERRVKKIRRYVHRLLCILPFEEDYFRARGCKALYVGNPVVDQVDTYTPTALDSLPQGRRVIAFLPGSRSHEVQRSIKVIRELAHLRPDWVVLVAGVGNLPAAAYQGMANLANVQLHFDRTYDLLRSSHAAVVTSGTATLETSLLRVPQVVAYRTSALTYALGRRLIKVPYISLVNLIAGTEVVREILQEDYTADRILLELERLTSPGPDKDQMLQGYSKVRRTLGSKRAAKTSALEIVALGKET